VPSPRARARGCANLCRQAHLLKTLSGLLPLRPKPLLDRRPPPLPERAPGGVGGRRRDREPPLPPSRRGPRARGDRGGALRFRPPRNPWPRAGGGAPRATVRGAGGLHVGLQRRRTRTRPSQTAPLAGGRRWGSLTATQMSMDQGVRMRYSEERGSDEEGGRRLDRRIDQDSCSHGCSWSDQENVNGSLPRVSRIAYVMVQRKREFGRSGKSELKVSQATSVARASRRLSRACSSLRSRAAWISLARPWSMSVGVT
jgi:hypothetical protein